MAAMCVTCIFISHYGRGLCGCGMRRYTLPWATSACSCQITKVAAAQAAAHAHAKGLPRDAVDSAMCHISVVLQDQQPLLRWRPRAWTRIHMPPPGCSVRRLISAASTPAGPPMRGASSKVKCAVSRATVTSCMIRASDCPIHLLKGVNQLAVHAVKKHIRDLQGGIPHLGTQ